jgi:hypothetical protein
MKAKIGRKIIQTTQLPRAMNRRRNFGAQRRKRIFVTSDLSAPTFWGAKWVGVTYDSCVAYVRFGEWELWFP